MRLVADTGDVLGYIQHDIDANDYTYWCPRCVPEKLREAHREVDSDEAENNNAACEGCGYRLATP